ncbi:MAG: PleD family two-component system response regulator [Phenylobacterium sp.]|uniref:response regulator n=1 Tax=Phenylobacterium sp. TaxID=1871053 RepID=UPI00391A6C05
MGLDANSRARFNFERASVLLLDGTPLGLEILVQVLTGFGAKTLHRAANADEAKDIIQRFAIDLAVVDASPTGEGYEFVAWLRRSKIEPNCYAPVLLTAGHTPTHAIEQARNCGADFIMKKPLTPKAVLERVVWIAREGRKFVDCDTYVGPDRRIKNEGVPGGGPGRRRDDLPPDVGEAVTPNMDQDMIDGLVPTQKVKL